MRKIKFKSAFSLAEILLTLAIIGVIAAVTIPTLKDYSDEMAVVSQVKKAYSDLAAATAAVETKYGDLQFWPWSDKTAIMNRYAEQMMFNESSGTSRTTQNGMTWSFSNGEDLGNGTTFGVGGMAIVDVNTSMKIDRNGVVPFGSDSIKSNTKFDDTYGVVNEGKVPSFH